ncbi:MAG: hypothetical protein MKZ95_18440, partial [Pirellulales bacterium]|nr:hypothetical protein [Pirellulales bacterium]
VPAESWTHFWHFYIWLIFIVGIGTSIWLTAVGIVDIRKMFDRLSSREKDTHDDGWVDKSEQANV